MSKTVMPSEALVTDGRSPAHRAINSPVIKRSIIRNGHKSSVSLEDQFWDGLREIADLRHMTVSALVATIDHGSNKRNLSSAIRVFVLDHFRNNNRQTKPPINTQHLDTPATISGVPRAS
jgi:predicted DNA-binding ribbon-helix-helix protein